MKKFIYLCVFVVVALFAFTLNLKNPETASLQYYFNISLEAPIVLIMTLVFLVGLVLGWLLMGLSLFKSKRQTGKAKRALAKVEKEVEGLRATPTQDPGL